MPDAAQARLTSWGESETALDLYRFVGIFVSGADWQKNSWVVEDTPIEGGLEQRESGESLRFGATDRTEVTQLSGLN